MSYLVRLQSCRGDYLYFLLFVPHTHTHTHTHTPQPPIIRLYDLHVRVNASVRSGVQLLLLEKGSFPEMFRLEFHNKKETKAYVVHVIIIYMYST